MGTTLFCLLAHTSPPPVQLTTSDAVMKYILRCNHSQEMLLVVFVKSLRSSAIFKDTDDKEKGEVPIEKCFRETFFGPDKLAS